MARWRSRSIPQGNVIIAGQTWSFDFPVPGGFQPTRTGYGEAFVVKLAPPGPPAITSVLNGASFQPGIEAGSWVMIQGTNLANTFPGRTWHDDGDRRRQPAHIARRRQRDDRRQAGVRVLHQPHADQRAGAFGQRGRRGERGGQQ